MSEFMKLEDVRKLHKGIKVERATGALPAGISAPIFNVLVGRVAITQIVGEVTTIIQVQINNTQLIGTPTVGTAVPICAILNITGDEVGCLYGVEGDPAVALIGIDAGGLPAQERDVVLPVGTLNLSCSATSSGSVKWTIFYVPIDDGAYITAA